MNPDETNNQPTHKSFRFDVKLFISVLSLLVSFALGSFIASNELNKEATTTRQSLTNVLEQIMDIDREVAEFQALSLPNEQKGFAAFSFTNRKMLLLRQAEELYKKLGEKTTAEDAAMIAVAYFHLGDFENAESHMKASVAKAKTLIIRASALRSLAAFAAILGDHSRATKFYNKALDEIGKPKNDMEINFTMATNQFKLYQAIARNDYDGAATFLKELVVSVQNLQCTQERRQWFETIYKMAQMLTPHLDVDISALLKADGKAKCIFDPPRSDSVKSAKSFSPYMGAYTFQNLRLRVFMWDDDTLSIAMLNQPPYLLKAKEDKGHFKVLGLSGSTAIFHLGATGDALELELIQPSGRFLWSRSG